MTRLVRALMAFEAATFILAGMVHAGLFVPGYEHDRARIAESVIGSALLAGLIVASVHPGRARPAAMAAQGFALLGTLVGLLTVALGVGPQSTPDLVYHIAILVVLAFGLTLARRIPDRRPPPA